MAVNKEFVFKIQVDTGNGTQEIQKVAKNLNDFDKLVTELNKEIRTTDFGTAKFNQLNSTLQQVRKSKQEVVTAAQKETEALNNNTKATEDSSKGFIALQRQIRETRKQLQLAQEQGDEEAFGRLKNQLDDLEDNYEIVNLKSKKFGDALAGLKGPLGIVGQGIQGVEQGFKLLIANPIIAVISAIVGVFLLLKESLSKTTEGQETLNRISGAFGKIIGPVMAIVESVAIPVFEALAEVIEFVAEGFNKFAQLLGISEDKIKEASKNSSEVLKKQAEDEKARQEEATKKLKEEEQKRAEERKKRAEEYKQNVKETQDAITAYEEEGRQARGLTRADEIADETKKYNELLKRAKKYGQDTEGITKAYREKIKKINSDFDDKDFQDSVKAADDKSNTLLAKKNQELQETIRLYGEESIQVKKIQDEIFQIQLQGLQNQILLFETKKQLTDDEILQLEKLKESYQTLLTTQKKTNDDRLKSDIQTNLQKKQEQKKSYDDEFTVKFEAAKFDYEAQQALLDEKVSQDKKYYDDLLSNQTLTAEQRKNIENDLTNNLAQNAQTQVEIDKLKFDSQQALLMATANAFSALSDIIGKETKAGKALSVASSLINTYTAIAGQLAAFAGVPVPGYAIVQAVATGLVGFKAVADILKTPVPENGSTTTAKGPSAASVPRPRGLAKGGMIFGPGSGTSDSVPALLSAGESIINSRSTRMFKPLLSTINQLGGGKKFAAGGIAELSTVQGQAMDSLNSALMSSTAPVKAYVVSGDLTNQQMFDRAQKSRSTL